MKELYGLIDDHIAQYQQGTARVLDLQQGRLPKRLTARPEYHLGSWSGGQYIEIRGCAGASSVACATPAPRIALRESGGFDPRRAHSESAEAMRPQSAGVRHFR